MSQHEALYTIGTDAQAWFDLADDYHESGDLISALDALTEADNLNQWALWIRSLRKRDYYTWYCETYNPTGQTEPVAECQPAESTQMVMF